MKLTKKHIQSRSKELCREHEENFKRAHPISKIEARRIEGEIFGLEWVLDHWESGYLVEEYYVNLGKKTFWWKVRVFLLAPLWLLSTAVSKKSWSEFTHGLISHKCEFDHNKPEIHGGYKFFPCKHFGCTIVDPED